MTDSVPDDVTTMASRIPVFSPELTISPSPAGRAAADLINEAITQMVDDLYRKAAQMGYAVVSSTEPVFDGEHIMATVNVIPDPRAPWPEIRAALAEDGIELPDLDRDR